MSRKDIVTGTFRVFFGTHLFLYVFHVYFGWLATQSIPPPPTAGSAPGIPSPKCIDREGLAGEKMSSRQTYEHWREQEAVSLYYTYVYSEKPKPLVMFLA